MAKDKFTKEWIIKNGVPIVKSYDNLTIRALHYRLVAIGMTNSTLHYKRVVNAMIEARWEGLLNFDDFVDHERDVEGSTDAEVTDVNGSIETGKEQIKSWMTYYNKNRWENQPIYPEVFIEKKALQGVFDKPCRRQRVALCPCKGYPSLTYMYQASQRFDEAISNGKRPVILYFGDYDPSGEDIPRSIRDTLARMGTDVEVKRIALMEQQVVEWNLPPAPIKPGDTRSGSWDGLGQVELDAVEPRELERMVTKAIEDVFDEDLYEELKEAEKTEQEQYKTELKEYVKTL